MFITNGGRPVTGTGERRTHLVQPGETLEGIARRHGTTVDAAMRLNPHIRNPDLIFHGTRIALPPGVATPRPPIAPLARPWPAPPRPRPPAVDWPAPPTIAPPMAWPAPPTPRPVPPAYTLPLPPAAARDPRYDNAGGRWPAPLTPAPRPAPAPGILGGIAGFFGGMAGGVLGFMDGIAGFFERLGWSPQVAKLLVWAIVIGAVGKVLTLRIRV